MSILDEKGLPFFVVAEKIDKDLENYLRKKGFKSSGTNKDGNYESFGYWAGTSVLINIDTKIFAPLRPGVKFCDYIGNKKITIKDFLKNFRNFGLNNVREYKRRNQDRHLVLS